METILSLLSHNPTLLLIFACFTPLVATLAILGAWQAQRQIRKIYTNPTSNAYNKPDTQRQLRFLGCSLSLGLFLMIIFVAAIAVARFTFDFGFLQLMLVFISGLGFTFAVGIIGSLLINKILFKNSKSERGKDA